MGLFSFLFKNKTNIFYLSGTHFVNIFVAIITLPILLHLLPIEEYGKWQFMLALQTCVLTTSAQQITIGAKRGIALNKDGTFLYALLQRGKILLITASFFLIGMCYFALTDRFTLSLLSGLSALYVFTNILFQTSISEYFIAKKEFSKSALWGILSSPVARIGSTIVAILTQSIVFFVLFQVAFALLISVIACFHLFLKKRLWLEYRLGNYDRSCVKYGLKSLPADLLGAISNRMVEIVIGVFFGFTPLTYFSVARDLRNQIGSVIKIISPLLFADFVKQPLSSLTVRIRKLLPKMIFLSSFLGASGVGIGILYILAFLPETFRASINILIIISLAFPLGIPTLLFGTILQAHLRYKALALATIVPNFLEIFFILVLGWIWGITGMAFAIAIFGFLSFLSHYLVTVKREAVINLFEKSGILKKIMQIY